MELTVIEENVTLELVDAHTITGPIIGSGGGGTIQSINGDIGPIVVLDSDDVGAAAASHSHTQSEVTGLVTALSSKADDTVVVKLTGAQTIAGIKTFSSMPVVPDATFTIAKTTGLQTAIDSKADDSVVVKLTGAQTLAGAKTFSSSPIVPDASFNISKTSGLQTALDSKAATVHSHAQADVTGLTTALTAKADDTAVVKLTGTQTIAGVKTFSSSPAVPDSSFAIAKTTNLQATLDAKALDNAVVKLTGAQTIAGVKTFSSSPVVPVSAFTIANTSGLQTAIDGKSPLVHDHSVTDIVVDDGPFDTAFMPAGYTLLVSKADSLYGTAGAWPVSRPGRADQYCHFIGDTDPGSISQDNDLWTAV